MLFQVTSRFISEIVVSNLQSAPTGSMQSMIYGLDDSNGGRNIDGVKALSCQYIDVSIESNFGSTEEGSFSYRHYLN